MTEQRGDVITGDASDWLGPDDYPDWLAQRLEAFQDLRFGFFMHWGIYSQWGCIESWPLVEEDTWARPDDLACWVERDRDLERFRRDYRALNETFDPRTFDPTAWAEVAKRAGMTYACFTTKHHDGFCLWDTATTDYKVTHPSCPFHDHPRADVVRQVFDAFRARGMDISCYFSKSDWHCPWYWKPGEPAPDRHPNYDTAAEPETWERFVRFVHAQVRELMSDYGPIDCLWLDGGQVRPPKQDIRMDEMVAMARALQPGLLVADRTVGGEHENIITPEQEIPDEPLGRAWESCITLGEGWSYRPDDRYKSAHTVVDMLTDIVARGGNLLLNVGPAPDGTMPPAAVEALEAVGRWMATHGEAIYRSRPLAPYADGPVRYTRRGTVGYAVVMADDAGNPPAPRVTLRGVRPAADRPVDLLGSPEPVAWKGIDGGAELEIPEGPPPVAPAWVFRFGIGDG